MSAGCPVGTGLGGNTATSAGDTRGGHGCVAFEYRGGFDTFVFTGAVQSWTAPADAVDVIVHLIGAGGGGGRSATQAYGGGGGYATGSLMVTPGQRFDVVVGEGGGRLCAADVPPLNDPVARRNFSFGGGATGNGLAPYDCTFAAGGGRSAIRLAGGTEDLVTAGGGGGGGYSGAGGGGGGLIGGTGGVAGGTGGTQSAGGASASPEIGVAGAKYAGGWAGFSATDDNAASEGGGGGGGYYGGGGAGDNGGGGGGSSFLGTLSGSSTSPAIGRLAGIALPSSSSPPTLPVRSAIGSTVTAIPAVWTGIGQSTYQWQYSALGVTFDDVSGATQLSFVPTAPGFVRFVERRSNFLGSGAATSGVAKVPDTRLSSLVTSTGSITPDFDAQRRSYNLAVGYRTTSIRLAPAAVQSGAIVRVGAETVAQGSESAPIELGVGDTTVVVRVEFEGVASETTIVVSRADAMSPSAPDITSIDGGDGTLTVNFAPPTDDGGEPITGYEYSLDGVSWQVVASTSGVFVIDGLKNGIKYEVRMRAVNRVGSSTASPPVIGRPTAKARVPSPATTDRSRSSLTSSTTLAESIVVIGQSTTTTTTISLQPSTSASPQADNKVGGSTVPTPSGITETTATRAMVFELVPDFGVGDPAEGARIRATAAGLQPASPVRLELRSEPMILAEGLTDAVGDAALEALLPADLPEGNHMLSLSGVDPDGETLVSAVALKIDARGVIAGVTPPGVELAALPDRPLVDKMIATNSAPYDASRDVAGAVALAGAAVVLMGLATRGGSAEGGGDSVPTREVGEGDRPNHGERDESAEGSLASTDAKVLEVGTRETRAWGDVSFLWMAPGWSAFSRLLRRVVSRVEKMSVLGVRILQDGTWSRAVFGVGACLPWVVGLTLGLFAAQSVDGLAVPPTFGFVAVIVGLSFLDSFAGAMAWIAFVGCVVARGGVGSWFDVRTLLGLAVLFVALPLIAASFRPIVRDAIDASDEMIQRLFDYLVVPLFVSYAASSVYTALNGLSGLAIVGDSKSDALRWLCLGFAMGRMLLEDATTSWFPRRRSEAALPVGGDTYAVIPYLNIVVLLGLYVLTAGPYMGSGMRTWLVMGLMCIVPLLKIHRDGFPNTVAIHRWLPRGILRSVVLLFAMAYYGRWIVDMTSGDAKAAVPMVLLPGIAIGIVDCFAREGGSWPPSRVKNLAGVALWVISFAVVAGWITP